MFITPIIFDMLKIVELTKSYRDSLAVDRLSLHVEQGDIFGFIGHNGAGKTTTIRAAAGALDFDSGDIFICGNSIKTDPISCKKQMAYIPSSPEVYTYMTGIQYLSFIADMFSVPDGERKRLIDDYAERFEMTRQLGNLISSYSQGMKQKISIIGALVHSPRVLMLDEPFVGLDPVASHTLKLIMAEICNDGGAIFFSTHVLDTAEKLCNKIAIIKQGRLIASGGMDELRGDKSLEELFLELVEK